MNTKHHDNHKQGRRLHRQPDAYELYELEHMQREPIKSPSNYLAPQPHQIYVSGVEAQRHWHPQEGGNHYELKRTYSPSMERDDVGDCKGDVDCEAEKFIVLEHEKFEQSNWMSMNK